MALISLRQLLDHAAEYGYGVPAFNVNNLEQTRAIMEAADKTDSAVIMQASAGARKYAGAPFLRALMEAAMTEFPHIPVVVHHGTSAAVFQRSIQLGFSSVMMDGSLGEDGKTPMDFSYNAGVTRHVVEMAHACGVSVEGEIGCLGSLETGEARNSWLIPGSTRWQSPAEPAMVPTNSLAPQPATFWRWIVSKPYTPVFPARIW